MRRIFLVLLALTLSGSPGCMALDEIDKANAKLSGSKKKKQAVAEEVATQKAQPNPLLEKSKQWWDEAKSLTPKSVNPGIVSCRVDGSTHFMAREDCLMKGGKPGGVSG